jgi:hypothetical protein
VRSVGSANTTGAITATSINISSPGPNGCNVGFGRPGGFGVGGGAGG